MSLILLAINISLLPTIPNIWKIHTNIALLNMKPLSSVHIVKVTLGAHTALNYNPDILICIITIVAILVAFLLWVRDRSLREIDRLQRLIVDMPRFYQTYYDSRLQESRALSRGFRYNRSIKASKAVIDEIIIVSDIIEQAKIGLRKCDELVTTARIMGLSIDENALGIDIIREGLETN